MLESMAGGEHGLIERVNQMLRGSGVGHKSDAMDKLAKASQGYRMLPREVFRLSEEKVREIRVLNDDRKNKMVYDSNGGGGYKIIPELLRDFIEVEEINNMPGKFVHKIEPVGDALSDATKEVKKSGAILGLATDCDADRGNLIGMDPQDVILLNVAGMLAWVTANSDLYPEAKNKKWAIVTHDATSLRTAEIAKRFGVEVFEVEIGETNVLTKMHDLEQEGYFVPIGVEGYSGGSVFMGTEGRDGALTALISILMLSDKRVFEVLLDKMGIKDQKVENAPSSLQDILNILPKYYTIQKDLKEEGVTASLEIIKGRLEVAFMKRIKEDSKRGVFKIVGLGDKEFKEYKFLNYEETRVLEGMSNRITQTGGFKILLTDTDDKKHFIWFRGSKTELGVFRACVDSSGKDFSDVLLNLQKSLYYEAIDKGITDEDLYYETAKGSRLKGIGLNIGSATNLGPAKGLRKGGMERVFQIDNRSFHETIEYGNGIFGMPGDATNLTAIFEVNSIDVAVFHNSLPFIIAHGAETFFGRILEQQGDGQMENSFFFIEILGKSLTQAYTVLKPGGALLIYTDMDFIKGRNPSVLLNADLIETLNFYNFIDIRQLEIYTKFGWKIFISARKPDSVTDSGDLLAAATAAQRAL